MSDFRIRKHAPIKQRKIDRISEIVLGPTLPRITVTHGLDSDDDTTADTFPSFQIKKESEESLNDYFVESKLYSS